MTEISASTLKNALLALADPEKAKHSHRFFKAQPGEYGEGDQFLGITVPQQWKMAKRYYTKISLPELEDLLHDPYHECRLTALQMLVLRYEKAMKKEDRQAIVDLYLKNTQYINNWDLVDTSAHKILGPYLFDKDRSVLYDLATSGNLWKQRIAVIATFYFIYKGEWDDSLRLAEMLLNHPHDLIHKAVGWMLREVGNRDFDTAKAFVLKHKNVMPRTMLRYAIEKYPEPLRKQILKGEI